jgi:DNA-binding response OmpR family regulator
MKLLLIEDSKMIRDSLTRGLRKSGFIVDVAADGTEGAWLAGEEDYDVIILDLMLPGKAGLEILQDLRSAGKTTHVLVLTARDSVDDKVAGLRTGADDYLVKPFAFEELIARVQALCRRKYGKKSPLLIINDLTINQVEAVVERAGRRIDLTSREYRLLELLALRKGEVVSRGEIERHLYGERVELSSNAVDSLICILRSKIDMKPFSPLLHTRRGHGYLLQV